MPLKIIAKETPYQVLTRLLLYQDKGYLEDVAQDCKGFFVYQSEVYVELRRHTKE